MCDILATGPKANCAMTTEEQMQRREKKFTAKPISPQRVLKVHSEKQKDLSRRGIR